MIAFEIFEVEFAVLEERFKCEYTPLVRDRYYEILSEELDNERFIAGCKEVFRSGKFFPSPQEIIDAAPKLGSMISAELKRLGMNGVLPPEWQARAGAVTVGDLSIEDTAAYLDYLRSLDFPPLLGTAEDRAA